jgi:hypothetical protein
MAHMAVAALAVQTIGTVVGGIEANKDGKRQGRVADENARLAELSGEDEALQSAKDERQMAGAMIAAMGASGTKFNGSNADLIEFSARQRDLEISKIRERAKGEATNYRTQAKDARRAGKNALIGAGFSAVAGALSGAADIRASRTLASQGAKERGSVPTGQIRLPSRTVFVPSQRTSPTGAYQLGTQRVPRTTG